MASSQFLIVTILNGVSVFANLMRKLPNFHTWLVSPLDLWLWSVRVVEWIVMKTCINKPLNPLGCVREFTTDIQLVVEIAEEVTQQRCSGPHYDQHSTALSQV